MENARIGASSACFYPLETEKALERVALLGFKTVEVFFNTPSELTGECYRRILELKAEHGLDIVSCHPFLSNAEGLCLFSTYKRRYEDFLERYKRVFEAFAGLGAKYFVLHGVSAQSKSAVDKDEYCQRVGELNRTAKTFGVQVAQENVVLYRSESPEYLSYMKSQLGQDFRSVLDVKQAYRAGYDPKEFLRLLGDSIVHIHLSDRTDGRDCIPPGQGEFDFGDFFKKAEGLGYNGKYIIELYRQSFSEDAELKTAAEHLRTCLNSK